MMLLKCKGLFLMIVECKYLNSRSVDRWRSKNEFNTAKLVDSPGPLQPFYTHILNVVLLYISCSRLCLIIIFCLFLLTCFFGHFVICSVFIYIFL